ncbi:hypothetical protein ACQWF6_24730, partial [Salmonella enterica subsp. enterica serovar Infantis]
VLLIRLLKPISPYHARHFGRAPGAPERVGGPPAARSFVVVFLGGRFCVLKCVVFRVGGLF